MATIKCFEDLLVWQKARELAKDIWDLTLKSPLSKVFSLTDQMRRSSGSTMDNIAEGFERGSNKEFIYFLFISKGSVGELRSQLYRAYDKGHIMENILKEYMKKSKEVSNIIGGLLNYLSSSKLKGKKFNLKLDSEL